MDSVWRDKLSKGNSLESADAVKPEFKSKAVFEEIKELDEEYIHASGLISIDNTEKILSSTSSILAKEMKNESALFESVEKKRKQRVFESEPKECQTSCRFNENNIAEAVNNIARKNISKQISRIPCKTEENFFEFKDKNEMSLNRITNKNANFGHLKEQEENEKLLTAKENTDTSNFISKGQKNSPFYCYHLKKLCSETKAKNLEGQSQLQISSNPGRTSSHDRRIQKTQSHSELLETFGDSETKRHRFENETEFGSHSRPLKKFVSSKNLAQKISEIESLKFSKQNKGKINFFSFHSKGISSSDQKQGKNSSICKSLKISFGACSDPKAKGQIKGNRLIKNKSSQREGNYGSMDTQGFSRRSEEKRRRGRLTHSGSFNQQTNAVKSAGFKSPNKLT